MKKEFTMNQGHDLFQAKIEGLRVISGINCKIKAEMVNGKLVGRLSSARSNKPYSFDFKPVYWRKTPDLE